MKMMSPLETDQSIVSKQAIFNTAAENRTQ